MNPNHPHYISGGPNLNLLDNMLMAAGFQTFSQATDQPKHTLVPQYTHYSQDMANMHMHQAINLVQPHIPTVTSSDPVHVIVYQQDAAQQQHQQQPISYKIPQLGVVTQQDQVTLGGGSQSVTPPQSQSSFVINEQPSSNQIRQHQYVTASAAPGRAVASVSTHLQTATRSPAERKKDIVAQAMQEQKIFEDSLPKTEVKQEPGVVPGVSPGLPPGVSPGIPPGVSPGIQPSIQPTIQPSIQPSVQQPSVVSSSVHTVVSSGLGLVPAAAATSIPVPVDTKTVIPKPDIKPVITTTAAVKTPIITKANPIVSKPIIKPSQQRLPQTYQQPHQLQCRSKDSPKLSLLEEEDDGLTCRLCLASYWYKKEMHEHLKTVHSIADPIKYEKEEKEKKLRRQREEQQRAGLAKKQREEKEARSKANSISRSNHSRNTGTIKLTSPGARPAQNPGARPSFQYRDGAFICDLCKESFSDGNDMVTHWKSHVKKQQMEGKAAASIGGNRGRGRGAVRGRGRPPVKREYRSDSEEEIRPPKKRSGVKNHKASKNSKAAKNDKGKPRWTAYLLWSTRKRRDVVVDHPDWTFAQIAKWISDEWKKIDADEKDELQKEAEEMNELGIRKLPRDDDGVDPERDTTDDDSDFEEGYRKREKNKPIMLKIKKEEKGASAGPEDSKPPPTKEGSDESDWEPEAELNVGQRESRSGRQRKRPSFFQEFESQENNLDHILQEFEETQAKEFGKPREPKPAKPAGERKPRKKKEKLPTVEPVVEELETEVLRSGRKRKVRRVLASFLEEDEDDLVTKGVSSDDDDFEPPPEEEVEKIEENDDQIEESDDMDMFDDDDDDDYDDIGPKRDHALPIKKRGRPKKILTDAEIEEATRAALGTIPVIEITPVPRPAGAGAAEKKDAGETKKSGETPSTNDAKDSEAFRPFFVNESLEEEQDKGEESITGDRNPLDDDPLNSEVVSNPLGMEQYAAPEDSNSKGGGASEVAVESEVTAGVNVLSAQLNEDEALLATVTCDEPTPAEVGDNPLGDADKLPEQVSLPNGRGPSEGLVTRSDDTEQAEMTEEDLLTGPAHNLDDSQYKADYADPNLDDIFK